MVFQNGNWLMKEGYARFSPAEVYEYKVYEDGVGLYMPTEPIRHKGDTLGGTCLSVRVTAPMPEVFRVEAWHFKGQKERQPSFPLRLPAVSPAVQIEDAEEMLVIRNGHASLEISKRDGSMAYFRDGELLSRSEGRDLMYIRKGFTGQAYVRADAEAYFSQQLLLSVDELIYGLGERFTPFVKNGQSVRIWNEDGGTSTEQSYKNIPFFLSNRGYGVFVNTSGEVEFEIGSSRVDRTQWSVRGEKLDYFFFAGADMKDALSRYTDLTGKPALPPAWSFGLWLSTSFTTDYDEHTVLSFIDGMLERGIPISVFHFDCCWMREFHWTDFLWDSRVFPDPEGLLRRIHEKGIKVCVWINPYIGQAAECFTEAKERGYLLHRPNGDVWQWDMWQPGCAIVDFTNPSARQWYREKLRGLLRMGVDCFKTDFGERIPLDSVYDNGAEPEGMHNYYTYLYNEAVFSLLLEERGEGEAVLFARSATAGCQCFPVHWGGDCNSDYSSMEQSLRGGLSLSSCGFGFWSHDIGGFESTSTADVYMRWAAFGLLSTHSRLHGSRSYRVPWQYGEEAVEAVRFFNALKLSLLPYLYSEAVHTHESGIPMLRSMAMEFPEDYACRYLDKQYMLGGCLLAAPIFREDGIAHYYLPEGAWSNYLTGELVPGGTYRQEAHGYCSIPLYVRENSILVASPGLRSAAADFSRDMEIQVYALGDAASSIVYQEGKEILRVHVMRRDGAVFGELSGPGSAGVKRAFLVNCFGRRERVEAEVRDGSFRYAPDDGVR